MASVSWWSLVAVALGVLLVAVAFVGVAADEEYGIDWQPIQPGKLVTGSLPSNSRAYFTLPGGATYMNVSLFPCQGMPVLQLSLEPAPNSGDNYTTNNAAIQTTFGSYPHLKPWYITVYSLDEPLKFQLILDSEDNLAPFTMLTATLVWAVATNCSAALYTPTGFSPTGESVEWSLYYYAADSLEQAKTVPFFTPCALEAIGVKVTSWVETAHQMWLPKVVILGNIRTDIVYVFSLLLHNSAGTTASGSITVTLPPGELQCNATNTQPIVKAVSVPTDL